MKEADTKEKAFNAEFSARTKAARVSRGWSQSEMAGFLDIPLERYKKYENRSPMPVFLIPRFVALTNCDLHFLMTGRVSSSPRKT